MTDRPGDDELETLRRRLQQARWRMRTAAAGGPEWDAAMAQIEDLEQELVRATRPGGQDAAAPPAQA